jgi:putative PIN family toxin of toxin-antitoxin system
VNRWRVVLDTNVLISAYRFGGKPQSILLLAQSGAFLPLTSTPLRIELSDVLNVKFQMEDQAIRNLCALFWQTAEWIEPRRQIHICSDEDDNRVLECALEGYADFIVTGDRHLLDLAHLPDFTILKPDAFLALFQAQNFKIDVPEFS